MFSYSLYSAIKNQNLRVTKKYRCIEEIVECCTEARLNLVKYIKTSPEVTKEVERYIGIYKQKLKDMGDRSWLCDKGLELTLDTIFTDALMLILKDEVLDEIQKKTQVPDSYIKELKRLTNKISRFASDAFYYYAKYIFSIYSGVYAMERNSVANNSSVAEFDYSYILSSLSILFAVGFYRFDLSKGSFPTYITIWLKNCNCHMPYKESVSLVESKDGERLARVTGTPLAESETEYASDIDNEIIDTVISSKIDTDTILTDRHISIFKNINRIVKRPLLLVVQNGSILL